MPRLRPRLAPFTFAAALPCLFAAAAFAGPNLIQNPGFDHDTFGWNSQAAFAWISGDRDGNLHSGAARLTSSGQSSALASGSCVAVTPGDDIVVSAEVWTDSSAAINRGGVGYAIFTSDNCSPDSGIATTVFPDPGTGAWHRVVRHYVVPATVHSMSPALAAIHTFGVSGPFQAYFDNVAFRHGRCVPGTAQTALCLNDERFEVKATWTANGQSGSAVGVPLTAESGSFWFFAPTNIELDVKVLNGCGVNNRYWVFAAGLTNVKVDLTVTDTATGVAQVYHNAAGHLFGTIADTGAFASCP